MKIPFSGKVLPSRVTRAQRIALARWERRRIAKVVASFYVAPAAQARAATQWREVEAAWRNLVVPVVLPATASPCS